MSLVVQDHDYYMYNKIAGVKKLFGQVISVKWSITIQAVQVNTEL